LEAIVVEADIAVAVRPALRVGAGDPVAGLAVGPADIVIVFVRNLKAEGSSGVAEARN